MMSAGVGRSSVNVNVIICGCDDRADNGCGSNVLLLTLLFSSCKLCQQPFARQGKCPYFGDGMRGQT